MTLITADFLSETIMPEILSGKNVKSDIGIKSFSDERKLTEIFTS